MTPHRPTLLSWIDRDRDLLVKFEGEKGRTAKYAQAYEICEYGRQPSQAELKQMFPF